MVDPRVRRILPRMASPHAAPAGALEDAGDRRLDPDVLKQLGRWENEGGAVAVAVVESREDAHPTQ